MRESDSDLAAVFFITQYQRWFVSVSLHNARAELFRTLGHPLRVRVLEMLKDGPLPVRDMLGQLDVEQSNLSQQLAVLRRAGLVTSMRDGGTVVYTLSTPHVADLMQATRSILTAILTEQEGLLSELRTEGKQ